MFYDLNVAFKPNDNELSRTLAFLSELGYNVVALNHVIVGKLPADPRCAIPAPLPVKDVPTGLEILRRVTVVLTEPLQNARLNELAKNYDVLALRPTDEKTLQLACGSYDCDLISLDLTIRYGFFFRHKTLSEAIKGGKRLELCYSQGLMGDTNARRNLISNATQLIRACRGRGMVISSEAKKALGLRGPWDAINIAVIWGLGQERGFEAMSKEARGVVVGAKLKRTGYRGVIDVVYGGEKPETTNANARESGGAVNGTGPVVQSAEGKQERRQIGGAKRKAGVMTNGDSVKDGDPETPVSKREMKRREKAAKIKAGQDVQGAINTGAA